MLRQQVDMYPGPFTVGPRRIVDCLCPDGTMRTAYCSNRGADTFFSIPARVYAKGKTVAGFVTRESLAGFTLIDIGNDPSVWKFFPYTYRKNWMLVTLPEGISSRMTPYGFVFWGTDWISVRGVEYELYEWAQRPGSSWPGAKLPDLQWIEADFDTDGLVDLRSNLSRDRWETDGPDSDEFNAWTSDVIEAASHPGLRDVLPKDHPCYFVTVGQFRGKA